MNLFRLPDLTVMCIFLKFASHFYREKPQFLFLILALPGTHQIWCLKNQDEGRNGVGVEGGEWVCIKSIGIHF